MSIERDISLSDEQIEEIIGHLRSGRRLPPHLFPFLFETSKEYQLAYAGKVRRADVLADTMAVPLQPVRTFGRGTGGWSNMLILGDNLQVLRRLIEIKHARKLRNRNGTDGVRLCYIDPPFATGEAWETRSGRVAYVDRVKGAEFIEWLRRRLILMCELLASNGTIVIHLDQRYVHYIKVIMDELLPGNFRNEIIAPRGIKGVQAQFDTIDALAQGHYSLLLYSKSSNTRFKKLLEPGSKPGKWDTFWRGTDRPTMRYPLLGITPERGQWRWESARAKKAVANYKRYLKEASDVPIEQYAADREVETGARPDFVRMGDRGQLQWYQYSGETKLSSDVWMGMRTRGSVTGYPTEKHEELIERLVSWLTDPGDLVLDAFAGSGTTAAVAERTDRRWIAIDCGKYALYTTQTRLLRQRTSDRRSFTVYNAGLYDYNAVRELDWPDYRQFALALFQCRDAPEMIAGLTFDGYLGDHRVLVYNPSEHPDARIGREFLEDIASLCGNRLGPRCFIVAPALAVEPYEDYLDIAGTRFFFLRIPYSIIAELHKRAFSELRQPDSKDVANATVDSVGFDFIQPPRVECDYTRVGEELTVTVREFESERYAAVESTADIQDLAMVMVDYNFEGAVFDLDAMWYGEDLAKVDYRIALPANAVGEQLMLIFLDVFGNEYREVKRPDDFQTRAKKRRKKGGSAT
jgi:16S rRNA G966 N2-methylase RsmD